MRNKHIILTAQHSTAQHSTAQHSTAQHSTAQHKLIVGLFIKRDYL
ncbi:methyltransferase [Butyrivibrio sp. FC2001]|nr:methyltransferase [Butyrivibrio sp. FC2001]